MSEERRKILDMLAQGKITAADAEKLLDATASAGPRAEPDLAAAEGAKPSGGRKEPKYLRIQVDAAKDGEGTEKVNIKVPFKLMRAGMKLAALMPSGARDKVSEALSKKGIDIDLSKAKGEDLEELIQHLAEISIDVDSDRERVRIFCE